MSGGGGGGRDDRFRHKPFNNDKNVSTPTNSASSHFSASNSRFSNVTINYQSHFAATLIAALEVPSHKRPQFN